MTDFIRVIDNVLTMDLCRTLIDRFEASAQRSPGRIGGGVDPRKKNSIDLTISGSRDWADVVAQADGLLTPHFISYCRTFSSLVLGALSPQVQNPRDQQRVTLTVENIESLGVKFLPALFQHCYRSDVVNVQKYEQRVGNFQHWHSEIYPEAGTDRALRRVLFWICYLNDVTQGGETEFLYQETRVQPRAGRLLIAPTGFTHTHRGNTPLSSDKYILTSWLMFQGASSLYS